MDSSSFVQLGSEIDRRLAMRVVVGQYRWTSDPKSERMARMNRLLSKFRHAQRQGSANSNGVSHVRVVRASVAHPRSGYVLTAAETAPCTCPDFCERDHDNE
jgi:hypothetical protein